MASFILKGLYRITPNMNSILTAVRYHNCHWLVNSENSYVDEIHWDSFKNLCLLEFLVSGKYSTNDLLKIRQNDQAPYMEFYLNEAGTEIINQGDVNLVKKFRTCFFLHFVDMSRPLLIGKQKIHLRQIDDLPDRLLPFTHYIPVD